VPRGKDFLYNIEAKRNLRSLTLPARLLRFLARVPRIKPHCVLFSQQTRFLSLKVTVFPFLKINCHEPATVWFSVERKNTFAEIISFYLCQKSCKFINNVFKLLYFSPPLPKTTLGKSLPPTFICS
jgi:hypothetical protein